MELKYKRTYAAKNRRYSVGEIPMMLGCAMEIVEPRPKLAEGKLNPGEICMILFGLTPDEYAWKDGGTRNLDDLEAQLRKNLPADRLIGFRVCDLKGAPVNRQVKLATGGSMDDGLFARKMKEKLGGLAGGPVDAKLVECRRLQRIASGKDAPEGVKQDWLRARRDLGLALSNLDRIYVAYDGPMNGRYPSMGFDGRVEIFTLKTRAENAQKQFATVHAGHDFWQMREISRDQMDAFFGRCASAGMMALRVDNGFAAVELALQDVMQVPPAQNMNLRNLMLREIQYGLRWNSLRQDNAPEKNVRGALESMLTMRNFAWHNAGNTVLYALCAVTGEPGGELCTAAAKQKLGMEDVRMVGGEKCLLAGEKMTGKQMLAVFTDRMLAASFAEQVPGNVRPVAMVFDELALRAQVAEGMLIDPATIGYRLPKTEFAKVQEMRGKPPVAVRIKPAQEETRPEAPAPQVQNEMGQLPDPDQFDPPAQPKQDEPVQEEPAVADDADSFLSRLFRKKKK